MLGRRLHGGNGVTGLQLRYSYKARMTSKRSQRTFPVTRAIIACGLAIVCAVAIAACGSANKPKTGSSAGSSQSRRLVSFSACMRSHGVSGFPDPSTKQGPNSFGIDGYNFNLPANMNTQAPAYESANKTCGQRIGPGSGSGHGIPAKAREAAMAHARCMRTHGVPNYPDPIFSGNGMSQRSGGPGTSPRSPAFQRAQKACTRG